MQGILSIQNTLENLMINFESHRTEFANIKQNIYSKRGVEERFQLLQSQADDTFGHFTQVIVRHRLLIKIPTDFQSKLSMNLLNTNIKVLNFRFSR